MRTTFFFLLLICFNLFAQTQKEFPKSKIPFNPEEYVCYKTNEPIKIDGKFDEKAWQNAEWTNYFVDIEGDLKPNPYFKTRTKMLWDDEYFYFAAQLEEPNIWANLTERDAVIFYDNDFEIFIDPDGDTHKYYEFEINAFNTQWDLLITKPYRDGENVALNGWDIAGLKTAIGIKGTINDPSDKDEYWTVEVAYPWAALKEMTSMKSPPNDGDQWRVNFSRVEWETEIIDGKYVKKVNPQTGKSLPENNWVWSPQGIIQMHAPETWGFVQFSNNLVGTSAKVKFNYNEKEDAKWVLRQIYYAQQDYLLKTGKFTNDLSELKIKFEKNPKDYLMPPIINTTVTQFEAILKSKDGESALVIYQDGLTKELNFNKEK
ncbi:MAG: carbohydrate-binding family 9-like protein [Ignavibacteriales bacterium]|nr:carbohydrate-binding family 9-like protein [Ignavibacteriales bacterium]